MRLEIIENDGRRIQTSKCVLLINWTELGYGYISTVMALPNQRQVDLETYNEIYAQAKGDEAVACFIEGDELVICGESSLAISF